MFQYILYLPLFSIVMKLVLIMPCVDKNLTKIREGWERNPQKESRQDSSTSMSCTDHTATSENMKIAK